MKRQKSFDNDGAKLYLVATPIGNMDEASPRVIETLKSVDFIAAEDTRNTGILLKRFDIHTKMITYHMFNEEESAKGIIDLIENGNSVAIVSDAGYPLLSDPGHNVVKKAIDNDIPVIVVNGPSAAICALVASGIPSEPFTFYGFLSSKKNERRKELEELKDRKETLIFYEAPHRIEKMLEDLQDILGDRAICLARELTKIHEEYLRGRVSDVRNFVQGLKGEMVIIVEGNHQRDIDLISMDQMMEEINRCVEEGMSPSEAIKKLAKEYGVSKNEIYRHYFS